MGDSQKSIEIQIYNSPLFDIDKNTEPARYQRESLKMVENLYHYLISQNPTKYLDFGLEITETATNCIKCYQKERGDFLHYFNKSFANTYRKAMRERQQSLDNGGIVISDTELKLFKTIRAYVESVGATSITPDELQQLSDALRIPKGKILHALNDNCYPTAISSIQTSTDGEEIDLFDVLPSPQAETEARLSKKQLVEFLRIINKEYLACQKRQQPVISDVMTIRLKPLLDDYDIAPNSFSFINVKILQLDYTPTQRDIAEKHGKNEASISRSVKMFLDKVKPKIKEFCDGEV